MVGPEQMEATARTAQGEERERSSRRWPSRSRPITTTPSARARPTARFRSSCSNRSGGSAACSSGERRIQLALRGCALLLLALVITAIGLLSALASTGRELDDLRVQNAHAVELATQLRQESDDLTRMARLYAVSGDERFREYFNEILEIRNGDAPRPEGYAWVYWDFVLPEGERPSSGGEAMSLAELRERAGLTASEAALLAEAEANSNSLVDLERRAFEAVTVGDRETAIALLHAWSICGARRRSCRLLRRLTPRWSSRASLRYGIWRTSAMGWRLVCMSCWASPWQRRPPWLGWRWLPAAQAD